MFWERTIKIYDKSVQRFMSYDWTNKQTDNQPNQDYYFTYKLIIGCSFSVGLFVSIKRQNVSNLINPNMN